MSSKEAADRDAAEKACREQEKRDKEKLEGMSVPASIEQRCSQVAQGVGGSYRAMEACVRQELANEQDATSKTVWPAAPAGTRLQVRDNASAGFRRHSRPYG